MRPAPRGGVILCGGHSRRMGRAKAWLEFGPERLLQRVVRLVGAATDVLVVVAAPGQDLPDLPRSVSVVRDAEADQGPLRGLATGLDVLASSVELVYAAATDSPFLSGGWVDRLASLVGAHDAAIPVVAGRAHPLAAIYGRRAALEAAEVLLDAGERRLLALPGRLDCRLVLPAELGDLDPDLATLRNLNTPDDYHQAMRDAGVRSSNLFPPVGPR